MRSQFMFYAPLLAAMACTSPQVSETGVVDTADTADTGDSAVNQPIEVSVLVRPLDCGGDVGSLLWLEEGTAVLGDVVDGELVGQMLPSLEGVHGLELTTDRQGACGLIWTTGDEGQLQAEFAVLSDGVVGPPSSLTMDHAEITVSRPIPTPDGWLAAVTADERIHVGKWSAEGALLNENTLDFAAHFGPSQTASRPELAYLGADPAEYGISVAFDSQVWAGTLNADLALVERPSSLDAMGGNSTRVVGSGSTLHMVWSQWYWDVGDRDLTIAVVSSDGVVQSQRKVGSNAFAPDVLHDEGDLLVVWQQNTGVANGISTSYIAVRRFDMTGQPKGAPMALTADEGTLQFDPKIVHVPQGFAVTWGTWSQAAGYGHWVQLFGDADL